MLSSDQNPSEDAMSSDASNCRSNLLYLKTMLWHSPRIRLEARVLSKICNQRNSHQGLPHSFQIRLEAQEMSKNCNCKSNISSRSWPSCPQPTSLEPQYWLTNLLRTQLSDSSALAQSISARQALACQSALCLLAQQHLLLQ